VIFLVPDLLRNWCQKCVVKLCLINSVRCRCGRRIVCGCASDVVMVMVMMLHLLIIDTAVLAVFPVMYLLTSEHSKNSFLTLTSSVIYQGFVLYCWISIFSLFAVVKEKWTRCTAITVGGARQGAYCILALKINLPQLRPYSLSNCISRTQVDEPFWKYSCLRVALKLL